MSEEEDGPFTCETVEIIDGASSVAFSCNAILDKHKRTMTMGNDDYPDVEVEII